MPAVIQCPTKFKDKVLSYVRNIVWTVSEDGDNTILSRKIISTFRRSKEDVLLRSLAIEKGVTTTCVSVITFKGSILYLNRGPVFSKGQIDLPKGRLEKGETVLECAMRELYEETGLVVPLEPVGVFLATYGDKKRMRTNMNVFRGTADEDTVTLSSEHRSYEWRVSLPPHSDMWIKDVIALTL